MNVRESVHCESEFLHPSKAVECWLCISRKKQLFGTVGELAGVYERAKEFDGSHQVSGNTAGHQDRFQLSAHDPRAAVDLLQQLQDSDEMAVNADWELRSASYLNFIHSFTNHKR